METGQRSYVIIKESTPVDFRMRRVDSIVRTLASENGSLTERLRLNDREVVMRVKDGKLYTYSNMYLENNPHILGYSSRKLRQDISPEEALSNARYSIALKLANDEMKSRQIEFRTRYNNYIGKRPYLLFKKFEEKTQKEEEIVLPEELLNEAGIADTA